MQLEDLKTAINHLSKTDLQVLQQWMAHNQTKKTTNNVTTQNMTFRPIDYRKYITIEADKRSGKPCIRGLRITVYDVLDYLASGMSQAEILDDFPMLTIEDLQACLAFAADRERRLSTVPPAA